MVLNPKTNTYLSRMGSLWEGWSNTHTRFGLLDLGVPTVCGCQSISVGGEGSCSTRGKGQHINNPVKMLSFPDKPDWVAVTNCVPVACSPFQEYGLDGGNTPLDQCADFSTFVSGGCGCADQGSCSVYGERKEVTLPDAIFTFPGYPSTPCSVFQEAG